MADTERSEPTTAAKRLATEVAEGTRSAILAGSVVTGHATPASDLDIVVIGDDPSAPYRRAVRYRGWPAEIFVHTEGTIHGFWRRKDERFRPALAMMCARGEIVLDTDGSAARIQTEAAALLDAGPPQLTNEELELLRYGVTDSLDDLLAGPRDAERPFILASLTQSTCDLAMENRRTFRGSGKWMFRMVEEADPDFAAELSVALSAAGAGDTGPIQALVHTELEKAGGALFEGFRADGRPLLEQD